MTINAASSVALGRTAISEAWAGGRLVWPRYVEQLFIQSLGVQDDDLRATVGGVVVSDTRWNQGWYNTDGEHPREDPPGVFPPTIPYLGKWPTITPSSWRKIRVTAAQAAALGLRMVAGMKVEVDVFDGWAVGLQFAPWIATVTWSDGTVDTHHGGTLWVGTAPHALPSPYGTYFSTGPHYFDYYPNGNFVL